jgi:hypothetical protein
MLRAQDVLVICKLFSLNGGDWTFNRLSDDLGISASEVHNSVARCKSSQHIICPGGALKVAPKNLFELLAYAVPRIFYAVRGGLEMGMPTGAHMPTIKMSFNSIDKTVPLVWPCSDGTVRGESLLPIYSSVPQAASKDTVLYELLSLVEIIRVGESKSKKQAIALLEKRILGKTGE